MSGFSRNIWIGYFCLILWCVISAFSRVLASNLLQSVSPFILCFYIFLIAAIFFLTLNVCRFRLFFRKILANKSDVLYFNLSTFGSWFFIIYPLKYIEPSLVVSINVSLAPIFTFLILPFLYHSDSHKGSKLYCVIFFTLFIYMTLIIFFNMSSLKVVSYRVVSLSIVFIAIGAFSLAANNIYAKRLSEKGFDPLENVAVRFFILIVLSAMISKLCHQSFFVDKEHIGNIFFVSFIYAIIPLYLIQISIKILSPMILSTGFALMPLTTFIVQIFYQRFDCSFWTISALVLVFILSLSSLIINYKRSF